MSSRHWSVFVAGVLGCSLLSADRLAAQGTHQPDSAKAATLAAVTVVAESDANWFVRAFERRQTVLALSAENRHLRNALRRYDAQIVTLEVRLDSLKHVETSTRAALTVLDDTIAAT